MTDERVRRDPEHRDRASPAERLIPTITMWNRLEGRPRRHDFDRALKAEVRDALWMLTKQWQMGEFTGRRRRVAGARPGRTSTPRG